MGVLMKKAKPAEMQKLSLLIADQLKKAGIGFVPIPILNDKDHALLVTMLTDRLEKIENECELEEL
jgi:hypothetical protein